MDPTLRILLWILLCSDPTFRILLWILLWILLCSDPTFRNFGSYIHDPTFADRPILDPTFGSYFGSYFVWILLWILHSRSYFCRPKVGSRKCLDPTFFTIESPGIYHTFVDTTYFDFEKKSRLAAWQAEIYHTFADTPYLIFFFLNFSPDPNVA